METEPSVDELELLVEDFTGAETAASLAGIFNFAPNFKLVGVNPGLAFSIFSQPWLVPQYCLAIDVKVSPSTTTWTVAALADATLVFVAAVVGVVKVDEVDGAFFPLGTTAPVGALDGLVALEDCAREVGADETVVG